MREKKVAWLVACLRLGREREREKVKMYKGRGEAKGNKEKPKTEETFFFDNLHQPQARKHKKITDQSRFQSGLPAPPSDSTRLTT